MASCLLLASSFFLASCEKDDNIDEQNAEAQRQAILAYKAAFAADSLTIIKYIADSSFKNVERRASGVYIVHKVAGTGTVLAQPGQSLTTYYKGYTIPANKLFDASSTNSTTGVRSPFSFTLNVDRVIRGWHEGFASMKKGEKAILLIPSGLAYGSEGAISGGVVVIPPDTPLRFDVELADVK
ncbi:MAG TPA: FKBP-type peptidyl-prolyl cis-trans isomerase [Hymenobacter sp.]